MSRVATSAHLITPPDWQIGSLTHAVDFLLAAKDHGTAGAGALGLQYVKRGGAKLNFWFNFMQMGMLCGSRLAN